jgi:hypothetical protein
MIGSWFRFHISFCLLLLFFPHARKGKINKSLTGKGSGEADSSFHGNGLFEVIRHII